MRREITPLNELYRGAFDIVCAAYNMNPELVILKGIPGARRVERTQVRSAFVYLTTEICNDRRVTLRSIGDFLDGRDHSTVLYARDTYLPFMRSCPLMRDLHDPLTTNLLDYFGCKTREVSDSDCDEISTQLKLLFRGTSLEDKIKIMNDYFKGEDVIVVPLSKVSIHGSIEEIHTGEARAHQTQTI